MIDCVRFMLFAEASHLQRALSPQALDSSTSQQQSGSPLRRSGTREACRGGKERASTSCDSLSSAALSLAPSPGAARTPPRRPLDPNSKGFVYTTAARFMAAAARLACCLRLRGLRRGAAAGATPWQLSRRRRPPVGDVQRRMQGHPSGRAALRFMGAPPGPPRPLSRIPPLLALLSSATARSQAPPCAQRSLKSGVRAPQAV